MRYNSPNAPKKINVLGSFVLSILAGYTPYAHITRIQWDCVNAPLLGMTKVVGEDIARNGLKAIEEKADDHDMGLKDKLAPFGILNIMTGLLTVIFGISFETSDFIVDCLEQWCDDNKELYRHIKQLVINLDNGPQNSSHKTQFMKRMIEFADKNNLEIILAF